MAELTDRQTDLFGRVARWQAALLKTRRDIVGLNKQITRLQEKRQGLQRRVSNFDTRIQGVLDNIAERTP